MVAMPDESASKHVLLHCRPELFLHTTMMIIRELFAHTETSGGTLTGAKNIMRMLTTENTAS